MPAGDRTGPRGLGPMSGRGLGCCAGYPAPGYMYPGGRGSLGRGLGFGRRPGRGFRRGTGRGFGRGLGRGPLWDRGLYDHPYYAGHYAPPVDPYGIPWNQPVGSVDEEALLADEVDILNEDLEAIQATVSYTHLDVYKRQVKNLPTKPSLSKLAKVIFQH